MNLFSLQIKTSNNFELNLQKLETKILKISKNSLVLAPELCLTGYAYKRLDEAVKITNKAIKLLKKLLMIVIFIMIILNYHIILINGLINLLNLIMMINKNVGNFKLLNH